MVQSNPKESEIIPVYNVENYLRECLDSVINQDALFTYNTSVSAETATFFDEALKYHQYRSAQNSVGDRQGNHIDCAYSFLSGLKDYLTHIGKYDQVERDFINYVIHVFYVDLTSKWRDSDSKKQTKEKVALWLDEFHANEQSLGYYYNLREYESLLRIVLTRKSVQETEQRHNRELLTGKQTVIPVVYASDLSYMGYTLVSMVSALQNARSDTFYAFTVLIPPNNEIDQADIDERLSRFDNYSLSFIELGNEFADLQMHIPHITSPTFYRLRIPSLLENYDKCIYLDGDTIVCEDLQRLYNIDLQDNYLGGVPAYAYYKKEAEHRKRLELSDDQTFQYFNAGVLLINLDKLREDKKEDQFLQLIEKDYTSQDQDILNIACYGKIQLLPYRYNVMTKYVKWKLETFPSQVMPYDIISGHMFPVIIHYADKVKPWNDCTSPYSNLWFSVAMTDICWDLFSDILVLKHTYEEQKKRAESLQNDLNIKQKEADTLRHALDCVHNSVSFRIGRGITCLPRKLRDLSIGAGKEKPDK